MAIWLRQQFMDSYAEYADNSFGYGKQISPLKGLVVVFQPTPRKVMEVSSEFPVCFSLCLAWHKLRVKLTLEDFEVLRCLLAIMFWSDESRVSKQLCDPKPVDVSLVQLI
ncbi:hypothetical protein ACH5RR_000532 [Cinchona calisaya]|uniref:NR LBD domain-containing protein n=1 Tax=Cinchona calisaya TaxID=153742 RepID=A0ABD3B143_9GENT